MNKILFVSIHFYGGWSRVKPIASTAAALCEKLKL